MRSLKSLALAACLLLGLAGQAWAAYTGNCAIWAMKRPTAQSEYVSKFYEGSQTGYDAAKAWAAPNGYIQIFPGCDGQINLGTFTDSVQVNYQDAGSWKTAGARATVVAPRLGPASSPTTGGAIRIVDGVTFSSDSTGVKAALAEVGTVGGGMVIVPRANITFSSYLNVPHGVTLQHLGGIWTFTKFSGIKLAEAALLKMSGVPSTQAGAAGYLTIDAGYTGYSLVTNADTTGAQQGCGMDGVYIEGNDAVGSLPRAIFLKGFGQPTYIHNTYVHQVKGTGIWLEGIATNAASVAHLSNIWVNKCSDHNIRVTGTASSVTMDRIDSETIAAGRAGIYLDGAAASAYNAAVTMNGIHIEVMASTSIGILISNFQNVHVNGLLYFGAGANGTLAKITGSTSDSHAIILENVYASTGSVAKLIDDVTDNYLFSGGGAVSRYTTDDEVGLNSKRCPDIASATSLTLGPCTLNHVTGTTTIDNITTAANETGRLLELWLGGAITVRDNSTSGGNIFLEGSRNLVGVSDDVLSLVSNGVNWIQRGGSRNGTLAIADAGTSITITGGISDTLRVAGRLDMNNSVILREGVNIATATTITIGNANFYTMTGNTTSTDIAGPAMPAGKHQIVTLYVTTGWHITAGNHWKINGNFDGNATGNKDSITIEWDGTDATEVGRVIQ